ncbi:MAG TPA: PQQ-binding-like beta-propeller repeat protein, partial [Planctomycetaceae bacterium]|nr:PQQ-binding-like beta-propeller repeat protein [Planctomycetaceae bacterium]
IWTIGSAAIKDDLLFIVDFSGLVHCLDAKKVVDGKPVVYWTHDMFAASWGSPLIVDGKVYCGDEDGDITIFELSKDLNIIAEINMVNSIYSTPVVANDTLFISNKSTLFAIKQGAKLEGGVKEDRRAAGGDSE